MQYFDSDIFPAQKSFLSVSGHIKIFPVLRLPSNEFCEDFLGHLNQKRIFTHFRIPLDSCFLILSDSYDMFCYSKMTFASLLICSILFSLRWLIKNWPAMWEIWVRSLCWEDPLEKGMATHYSILAWRIPWAEELGSLQSTGSQSQTRRMLLLSFSLKSLLNSLGNLNCTLQLECPVNAC